MKDAGPIPSGSSAGRAQRTLSARFATAGFETPALDARLLLEAVTGRTREQLVLEPERPLTEHQCTVLSGFASRHLEHEPISRILGRRGFWGRMFEVTPATLDPRGDTETLVELALYLARQEGWSDGPLRILDVGTGTGCILITLLLELRQASGMGTDISGAALDVAARNWGHHAPHSAAVDGNPRVIWQQADLLDGLEGRFNLIVCNPPYIPSADLPTLALEVRDFDPHLALDGGSDGLDYYRRLLMGVDSVTRSDSWCIVEIGEGQATGLLELIEQHCGSVVAKTAITRTDLGGHTRCVAWKPRSQR